MKKYVLGLLGFLFCSFSYADPVLDYNSLIVYSDASTPPASSTTMLDNLTPTYFWKDTLTNDFYFNLNPDRNNFEWTKIITDLNLAASLPNDLLTSENLVENLPENLQNTQLGVSRSYSDLSSPAFNTAYQPSTTRDSFISAKFSLTSTVLTASDLTAEVNTGAGYSAVGECGLSGLAATSKCTISFPVPKSASYRFIQVSGTSSIIGVKKLDL